MDVLKRDKIVDEWNEEKMLWTKERRKQGFFVIKNMRTEIKSTTEGLEDKFEEILQKVERKHEGIKTAKHDDMRGLV